MPDIDAFEFPEEFLIVDAAVFAVNMLVNTETGGSWTYAQYKAWLEDAGFSVLPYDEVAGTELIAAHKDCSFARRLTEFFGNVGRMYDDSIWNVYP